MAYRMARLPMTLNEAVLNLCNTHYSGNIACFNYIVFTHILESLHALRFTFYCQRTSQCLRQSHTLEKW